MNYKRIQIFEDLKKISSACQDKVIFFNNFYLKSEEDEHIFLIGLSEQLHLQPFISDFQQLAKRFLWLQEYDIESILRMFIQKSQSETLLTYFNNVNLPPRIAMGITLNEKLFQLRLVDSGVFSKDFDLCFCVKKKGYTGNNRYYEDYVPKNKTSLNLNYKEDFFTCQIKQDQRIEIIPYTLEVREFCKVLEIGQYSLSLNYATKNYKENMLLAGKAIHFDLINNKYNYKQ